MRFLESIYNCSEGQANKEICKIAKGLGINLLYGDNFNWLNDEDEHLKEEGIFVNENLVALLESQKVDFSDAIREDFHSMTEGESMKVYFRDDSGIYSAYLYLDYLDVDGVETFDVWIDFNNLYNETRTIDLNSLPTQE